MLQIVVFQCCAVVFSCLILALTNGIGQSICKLGGSFGGLKGKAAPPTSFFKPEEGKTTSVFSVFDIFFWYTLGFNVERRSTREKNGVSKVGCLQVHVSKRYFGSFNS